MPAMREIARRNGTPHGALVTAERALLLAAEAFGFLLFLFDIHFSRGSFFRLGLEVNIIFKHVFRVFIGFDIHTSSIPHAISQQYQSTVYFGEKTLRYRASSFLNPIQEKLIFMLGYLGIFLLAWFLGWAFFIVLSLYVAYRLSLRYRILAHTEAYFERLATFEENLEVAAQ
jgi:hypothetical protein